ncbi:hypothetical protein CSC62_14015 [Pseudoxanthomonas jiangsuensis]|uniref:hypothetical protein n=1 Tax=Pseudoxanthomonas jiangsuensis TaxID=619688 RepID=UPI001391CD90|nr:hypothetical protein [Pseudoxanthomonas jiangsuensis]KAF1692746.1 hypothetical protein CSC62_14015 [Pseudoxanthomonas jiangsuensis]
MLTDTALAPAKAQLLPWVLGGIVLAILAAAGAGLWAGNRWAAGQHAIEESRELRATAQQQATRITELRELATDATLAYDQAAQRLDLITEQLEKDRESNRAHREAMRADLARLLAARPDLRDGRAGDDVLQHWNRSNAGQPTAGAAAADSAEPAAAVPDAAGGTGRSLGNPAGEPRPGGRAVPRLQERQDGADRGGAGVVGDGVGLVLPGGDRGRGEG